MNKFILTISFFLLSSPAWATTYYVRDGGGAYGTSSTTCNGLTNAVYTTGSGPNCAVSHPAYIMGVTGANGTGGAQIWSGGDTLSIDGDSDTTPGTQAQYMVGYGMPNTGSACNVSFQYFCILDDIPAGSSSSARTKIIGTGNNKPQLWSVANAYQVISSPNNHVLMQSIEITDHYACAYQDPVQGCPTLTGNTQFDGMTLAGDDVNLTDIYIHGLSRWGINGGAFGSATFTRVYVIGNGNSGIQIGSGGTQAVTGTLTFNQPIIEWNGCVEAYPLTGGIDNPANYSQCFGQDSGVEFANGDGLAFGATGSEAAGSWTLIGPGSISFNTQDGLDTLHGNSSGTGQIDKMKFEGNAGQQIKANFQNTYLTNSLVIGDCGWWYTSAQAGSGQMTPDVGDNHGSCRANGDSILFNTPANANINIYNNTIFSNGSVVLLQNGTCDSSVTLNVKNNIIQGGFDWYDDTTWNGGGSNKLVAYFFDGGTDGSGSGCTGLVWHEDYNIVTGTKSSNSGCTGAHDKCGTSPSFTGTLPLGTSGGGVSTYYQGQLGIYQVPIASNSAAVGAGVASLSYWNNENDYYNVSRTNPPAMGGLEVSSCAVNSFDPCLYNADCCSGLCSNNICASAPAAYKLIFPTKFFGKIQEKMMNDTALPYDSNEDDKEKRVYMTLSLAKYPFFKNKKRGEKGEAKFKGEIERSETHSDSGEGHHTICFNDLSNAQAGRRI